MGTAYQVPSMASYESHSIHRFPAYASSRTPHADRFDRPRPVIPEHMHSTTSRSTTHTPDPVFPPPRLAISSTSTSQPFGQLASHSLPQHTTRSSTASSTSGGPVTSQMDQALSLRDSTMVLHSLVIPACISARGGNLADFAAQITALFWFESITVLELAEKVQDLESTQAIRRLNPAAIVSSHFKKWVQSVLSTTQVTQNVILLALMLIYRLKVANPQVNGRPGSEYRLLTVALMLGNKFLDDNTYTNKTWAEVSGISVSEIHVMEVEFLSNMRYSLLATKGQWEEWLVKLSRFWDYLDLSERPSSSPSSLEIGSPRYRDASPPLASPTATSLVGSGHTALCVRPTTQLRCAPTYSPSLNTYAHTSGEAHWQGIYVSNSTISPSASRPRQEPTRKRSFPENELTGSPAKRPNLGQSHQSLLTSPLGLGQQTLQSIPQASQHQEALAQRQRHVSANPSHTQIRLSVPNLTINTSRTIEPTDPNILPAASNYGQHSSAAQFLLPGVRAMSTIYPSIANTCSAQIPTTVTAGSKNLTPGPTTLTPPTAYPPVMYGTPTRRPSPQNAVISNTPSPLNESFSQHSVTPHGLKSTASGTHTPVAHSPSIYLQQRLSPYKPVRHFNTLLYPPPSAFLQRYHFANMIPPSQMYYQPLGRRNEFRTGIVPEFAMTSTAHYDTVSAEPHHVTSPSTQRVQTLYSQSRVQSSVHTLDISRSVPFDYNTYN